MTGHKHEEVGRARRFPGVGFRGDDARRRAWVIGTGLDVWEVCQLVDDLGSIGAVVEDMHLSERQARLALAYREHHPAEIEEALEENRRTPEEWRVLYPFVRAFPGDAGVVVSL